MEVTVKPTADEDIDEIFALRRDPEVLREQYALSRSASPDKFKQRLAGKPNAIGISFRCTSIFADGKLVGHVLQHFGPGSEKGLMSVDCGWNLKPTYWGRGIMPGALRQLFRQLFNENPNLVVYASCFETNQRSKRVMEKLGFKPDKMGWVVWLAHLIRSRGRRVLQYRLDRVGFESLFKAVDENA